MSLRVNPPTVRPFGTPLSIGFNLERIGLIAFTVAIFIGFLTAVLLLGGAFGIARIKVDDSLSQLFRSDTPEFKTFEKVTRRFPSNEFDVLIVVEGKTLLERASIEKLRDLVADLQLIDGTSGVISMFSAREPPEDGKLSSPLFPETIPEGPEYDKLIKRVMENDIIRGKLLSEDGELTLIVLALDPNAVASSRPREVVGEIQRTIDEDLNGTELSARLSGVPVMQLEIRNAVERDRLFYNVFGFAIGALIAVAFFRRVSFMIIAAGPPLVAIVLALGVLSWLDFRLNMFLNVMTPLVMVISFSDSMQLTFAARDRLLRGENKYQAFRSAILIVGPACVLTHATAALSFIALQFSTSHLIRTSAKPALLRRASRWLPFSCCYLLLASSCCETRARSSLGSRDPTSDWTPFAVFAPGSPGAWSGVLASIA
jgi:predicted RND superfamily exporter protein